MTKETNFDEWEIRILHLLQGNGEISMAELAERVGLSQTPCWRRVKRLKEMGVIKRTVAIADRHALGLDFVAYALIKLAMPNRENMEIFERAMVARPEVVTCEKITGAVDYVIKVLCPSIQAFDVFLRDHVHGLGVIADTQSRIVVCTIKEETALPVRRDGT